MKFRIICQSVLIAANMAIYLSACSGKGPGQHPVESGGSPAVVDPFTMVACSDTVLKWQNWAMRSGEGLWENNPSHSIHLTLAGTYGGEDNTDPPFYSVRWMQVTGDTLFIADRVRECLVCMDSDGEVLWEYGEPGEGPGYFRTIGPIAVSDSWLAVCNIEGDRVELLTRSGELFNEFSVLNPLYVVTVNEGTFAVLSRQEPGGDIHLYDVNGGHLSSFGECPWIGGEFFQRSINAYSAVCIDNRFLVMNEFFTYRILVFDLIEEELVTEFARDHPSGSLPSSSITALEDGYTSGVFYFQLGKMFTGPEGAINIRLDAIQKDGTVINSRETIGPAPVTVIDRYDLAGEYLDSYCIPLPNCTSFSYSEPYLYVAQSSTGTVFQFRIEQP